MRMRTAVSILLLLALSACEELPARREPVRMQTIENTPPTKVRVDPPPMLEEQALPARQAVRSPRGKSPDAGPTPEEELKAKTNLPFAPAIAMDPVDGSKMSITVDTPIYSYEGRWYYFSSEANRRAFRANPKQYLEDQLTSF
ncbi:MAG TPA: YHS domain-containing protein [Thermoanaerobaculia bacterium]|nr:YHS domain-containing protein [Thermoanaerobaculia bacterium]